MNKFKITLLFILCISFSPKAAAGIVDLNLLYYSDSLSSTTTASTSRSFYDLCVAFSVLKNNEMLIGWNYASYSTSDASAGVTTTYAATQMGPKFIYFLNKDHNWRIGAAYNVLATGTYQNGASASETWKGMAYSIDLGYQFTLSDSVLFGARFNYSTSNYTEKLISSVYSSASSTRTLIYPSLAVSYLW